MKVRIPPTLRTATGGEREVSGRGDTVRELLDDLMSRVPRARRAAPVRQRLRRRRGHPHPRRARDAGARGATVILLPAMAGGCLTGVRELYELWARTRTPPSRASSSGAWIRAARTGSSSSSPRSGRAPATSSSTSAPATAAPPASRLDRGARRGGESRSTPCPQERRRPRGRRSRSCPLADASVDWIWCRDVLVHVDVERGLAECARVLKPGGRMLAYVTLATELLEPREARVARWTRCALATPRRRADRSGCRRGAASRADESEVLGGEWRERMIEDGEWDVRTRR